METTQILAEIDAEIQRLQQARVLLSDSSVATHSAGTAVHSKAAKKRFLSPEARARIAAAQRARWAKARKAAK
jgi:hypothetical protein